MKDMSVSVTNTQKQIEHIKKQVQNLDSKNRQLADELKPLSKMAKESQKLRRVMLDEDDDDEPKAMSRNTQMVNSSVLVDAGTRMDL